MNIEYLTVTECYMSNWPKISSYFNEESFISESRIINLYGPQYVGHKLMVKSPDDFKVLETTSDRYVLFNHAGEYNLVSNVCAHRQAQLLEGCGKTKTINCKLHCWTFSNKGKLLGAPHFKDKVEDSDLGVVPLKEWNGLLFKNRAPECNLADYGLAEYINFDNYFYAGTESATYDFNWKSFMEIYLENYHVFSMHPGLKHFVKPSDLEWVIGKDFSIQKVGLGGDLSKFGTVIYKDWHEAVKRQYGGNLPRYGAIWMLVYPNIMIEWYPHVMVVSTVYPKSASRCENHVEFYYNKKIYENDPDFFTKEKSAYMETAEEDNEACLLLEKGRRSLFENNEESYGPIDSFLEKGVSEFYDYLKNSNC